MPDGGDPLAQRLVIAGKLPLKNRLVKAATAEGMATRGGNPSDSLIQLYGHWARGGSGLLITGNAHVDRRYRERSTSMIVDGQSDRDAYRRLAAVAHDHGAHILLQLNHPGRQCPAFITREPVAPSASRPLFRFSGYAPARAMRGDEIDAVIEAFAKGAQIAENCGFDGIQIHAAHGYLISAFLSPVQNRRIDGYGGSLAARSRLLLEIIAAVRAAVTPRFLVAIKLNATDFERGGLEVEEAVAVARLAREAGADCVETSGGTYRRLTIAGEATDDRWLAGVSSGEASFGRFAQSIVASAHMPVILTGGVRTRDHMTRAIERDGVSLIGLARPLCVDPLASAKLLDGRLADLSMLPGPPDIGLSSWFGSASPWRRVRRYNAFAALAWYSEQLHHIAEGRAIDPALSPRRALRQMMQADRQAAQLTRP